MWSHSISFAFSVSSKFYWIRTSRVLICFVWYDKNIIYIVLINSLPDISLSSTWSTKHAHRYQQQDGFYLEQQFFSFTFESIYNKVLQSGFLNPSISNNMWLHVFRSKVRAYFPCSLVTYMAYIFFIFLYLEILHLLQRQEGVRIHCKLIPDYIKSTP